MSKRNHDKLRAAYQASREYRQFLEHWIYRLEGKKTAHQLIAECAPCDIDAVHRKKHA